MTDKEDLRTRPDSVPNYVAQLFTLSEKMLKADATDWAIEVRAIANCLVEGLNLDNQTLDDDQNLSMILNWTFVNGDLIEYDDNGNRIEAD